MNLTNPPFYNPMKIKSLKKSGLEKSLGLFGVVFLLVFGNALLAEKTGGGNVSASFIPEALTAKPGTTNRIGLFLKMKPDWHTYWRNPGDSGLETKILWSLPQGYRASGIRFPLPHIITNEGLVNFAYEKEVLLVTEIFIPSSAQPGTTVRLPAKVEWLECAEVCIPGKTELEVSFLVGDKIVTNGPAVPLFQKSEQLHPAVLPNVKSKVARQGKDLILTLEPVKGKFPKGSAFSFFPWDGDLLQPKSEVIEASEKRVRIRLHPNSSQKQISVVRGGVHASLGFGDGTESRALWIENEVGASDAGQPLWLILLYAFLGGLILNLMPCVFPVLSIKIVGFVRHARDDVALIRRQGWVYFAGVVISFLIIAGILIALRAGGEALGWGFQLQTPYFVGFLIYLMFLVGLNLMGVFEFAGFANVGGELVYKKGLTGSFWSGVLAVLIASPCTGPFMGAALGFALAQPPIVGLSVFLFLGIGMGLPYLLLSYQQSWLQKLPKPGEWMNVFKQIMAFPMFATVLWLLWVYGKQTGADGIVLVSAGLLLVSVIAWIWGRWLLPHKSKRTQFVALMSMVLLAGLAIYVAIFAASQKNEGTSVKSGVTQLSGIAWETFHPDRIKALEKEGRPYFIDFTAAWCLTCQVNHKTSLSSQKVAQKIKELGDRAGPRRLDGS